jgi:cbb3-type cytochrome oxidase subunit 3
MRFLKNPNLTVAVLAVYTAVVYIIFFPRNNEMSDTEKWLTVGASVVMLALLWVLLRRRDRLRREREEDEKRG